MRALLCSIFLVACGRSDLDTMPAADASTPVGDSASDACGADIQRDPKNCGACGNACPASAVCTMGACTPCPAGFAVCGDACTDLGGDAKSCGACGKACGPNQVCASGVCATSCPIGRSKCGNDCVDVLKDPANCGNCGLACKGGEVCVSGLCCQVGQTSCAGKCADLTSDPKNCGSCGNVCPMGACSSGMCSACKKTVLLVADNAPSTSELAKAITSAGYAVTTASVSAYAGTPAASGFAVIVITNGTQWSADMPSAGQTAIVSAHAAGAGVVMTEWVNYEIEQSRYQTLKPLALFSRQNGVNSKLDFSSQLAHPIWAGLPASFTTVNSMGANVSGSLASGAASIATCAQCGVGVAIKETNNQGRVVQIAHAGSFMSGGAAWTNDTNITRMMTNAIGWAARCT